MTDTTAPDHHSPDGRFRNPWPGAGTPPGLRDVARWMLWERLVHRMPRQPSASTFARATPAHPTRVAAPGLALTWVGHSSFLLQLDGVNLLTDPVWGMRASPFRFMGPKRWVPPGIPFDALPPVDAVLISHSHYDHLDDETVRRLVHRYPDAAWFAPLGLSRFLETRGARRVVELDWWGEESLGALRIACTPAQHGSARGFGDQGRTLWCGWSVLGPSRRVHFLGDSAYYPELARISERNGPFDLVLVPIGAYEPRWFMKRVHMNADESVWAYLDLCAPHERAGETVMVAMHWGTFKLTDEAMDEPPRRVREAWRAAGLPESALWVMQHGETRELHPIPVPRTTPPPAA